jgi:hypothetical protein
MAALGLMCETNGIITNQAELQNHKEPVMSSIYDKISSQNYEKHNGIETVADLREYEHHANLLRTIRKAGLWAWFEDSNGRNGLHCLAEVLLKFSVHGAPSSNVPHTKLDDPARALNPRERYLIDLLNSGVDPNNYDKQGHTPLMAFITHLRADEDDELTTRLLHLLVQKKANIHYRNRQGETALHIAVKLGRRAATKFLLQHKANVHARTASGMGVLALGQEACKKSRDDQVLYAQSMLCMSLAIDSGAVSAPTVLQEWASL